MITEIGIGGRNKQHGDLLRMAAKNPVEREAAQRLARVMLAFWQEIVAELEASSST